MKNLLIFSVLICATLCLHGADSNTLTPYEPSAQDLERNFTEAARLYIASLPQDSSLYKEVRCPRLGSFRIIFIPDPIIEDNKQQLSAPSKTRCLYQQRKASTDVSPITKEEIRMFLDRPNAYDKREELLDLYKAKIKAQQHLILTGLKLKLMTIDLENQPFLATKIEIYLAETNHIHAEIKWLDEQRDFILRNFIDGPIKGFRTFNIKGKAITGDTRKAMLQDILQQKDNALRELYYIEEQQDRKALILAHQKLKVTIRTQKDCELLTAEQDDMVVRLKLL